MSYLDDALKAMHDAHKAAIEANKTRAELGKKFGPKFKALDKAKDEKAFEKQKKECEELLEKIAEAMKTAKEKNDDWAAKVKTAKEKLDWDGSHNQEMRREYVKNLEKCRVYNADVKKFNEALKAAQKGGARLDEKPKDLIPELDPDKAMQPRIDMLLKAAKAISDNDGQARAATDLDEKVAKAHGEAAKALKEKEFKPAKKKK
jgi:hypothetical protein